jgi:hypothetical protein
MRVKISSALTLLAASLCVSAFSGCVGMQKAGTPRGADQEVGHRGEK